MSPDGGLRKRRANYFVTVDRKTVRNAAMSYRALGLLTYLLDLPEGWEVKSEVLAQGEGREGREAVRTALRELAEQGHYRIERRQARDGKFSMGTAISEDPVPEWIADFHEYGGKPVVVVQQADGSYEVLHKDGSTSPDGFPSPEAETQGLPVPEAGPSDIGAGQTEDGFPGVGFPGVGSPVDGSPDSGFLGVTREREKGDREGRTTEDSLRSSSEQQTELPIDAEPKTATRRRASKGDPNEATLKLKAEAKAGADWWWKEAETRWGKCVKPGNPYMALRKLIEAALKTGMTPAQVTLALEDCALQAKGDASHLPYPTSWQRACSKITGHRVRDFGPRQTTNHFVVQANTNRLADETAAAFQ